MFDRVAVFRCRLEICQYVTPHATGGGTSSSSLGTLFLASFQGAGCSPGGSQTMHHELYSSIVSYGSKFFSSILLLGKPNVIFPSV